MNPPEQDVLLGADVQTARLAEPPDNIFYDSVTSQNLHLKT